MGGVGGVEGGGEGCRPGRETLEGFSEATPEEAGLTRDPGDSQDVKRL